MARPPLLVTLEGEGEGEVEGEGLRGRFLPAVVVAAEVSVRVTAAEGTATGALSAT